MFIDKLMKSKSVFKTMSYASFKRPLHIPSSNKTSYTKRRSFVVTAQTKLPHDPKMNSTGVLFVCLGNVCRSPTAEAVFNSEIKKRKVEDRYIVDSCGTGGGNPNWYFDGEWSYHEGEESDPRMKTAARQRDIHLTSRSRPLTPKDLTTYEYLVAMDKSNVDEMKNAIEHWSKKEPSLASAVEKIILMTDYCQNQKFKALGKVPDPYYGGPEGFDLVLDVLIDACNGLLEKLSQDVSQ